MKRFIILMMAIFLLTLTGCATTSNLCPMEGSVICALAEKMKTTPENMNIALEIAQVTALEQGVITGKEASAFIDSIIDDLDRVKDLHITVTYAEVLDYINGKFRLFSPQLQACFIIMNPSLLQEYEFGGVPLNDYDLALLKKHLKNQKALAEVYK